MESFRLAPMTTGLRILTMVVLPIPLVIAVAAWSAPGPVQLGLLAVAGFMALIYLSVWLWWRPSRFEISARGLTIVWPLRSRTTPAHALREIFLLEKDGFRREYRYGIRVGAGGLWGAFGRLLTAKGMLEMYISRTDAFVMLHRAGDRTLMLTPEQPERFIQALKAVAAP